MTIELKVRNIGGSLCVELPEEMIARLNVREGSLLYLAETEDGGYVLVSDHPHRERILAKAKEIMKRYHNTLRRLSQ
ncbi:AbrB family transcriptional regulator [Tistrella mobilis]|uniref:AbrB family transcriptional regulator n=1 Tax=Tistrella mobilis TaxID=171437 RepID=A0A161QYL9_9PROT|nr:hypothetical protein [Tistrella mobilis]KYO49773.1 AbrB family transcriptional regulator [Tistrella mobilis]